jgi:hypothetical protein
MTITHKPMKKALLFLLLLSVSFTYAQEEKSDEPVRSKFSIHYEAKYGITEVNLKNQPNLSGNSTAGAIDVSYAFSEGFNLTTGVQFTEFKTNFLDAHIDASIITIPLKFSDYTFFDTNKDKGFKLLYGFGVYTNHLRRISTDSFSIGRDRETNIGWNFGWLAELGIFFEVSKKADFGILFEAQNDFTNAESDRGFKFTQNFIKLSYVQKF